MFDSQNSLLKLWQPKQGTVSSSLIVLHTVLTGRSTTSPWLARGARELLADDGESWWYINPLCLARFLAAQTGCDLAFHDAPQQLDALSAATPCFDVYQFVDRSQVWDTWIQCRLVGLGFEGETGGQRLRAPQIASTNLEKMAGWNNNFRFLPMISIVQRRCGLPARFIGSSEFC